METHEADDRQGRPTKLPRAPAGPHVFRRAERGRPRLHVDVRGEAAVDDRRAGPDRLGEHEAGQQLGVLLHQRARNGHWRGGSGEGEGSDDADLARRGEVDEPLAHRDVQDQGRVGVDHRVGVRPVPEPGLVDAVAQAQELERVRDLRGAPRVDEGRLVGIQHLDPHHLEMAEARVDVLGFDRRSGHVDYVKGVGEAHEVAEVLEGSGPLATGGVHRIRRAPDRNELRVSSADVEGAGGAGQGELRWGRGDGRLDQLPPEAHLVPGNRRAGASEEPARTIVFDLNAQLFEHGERGRVDLRDLLVRVAPGERKGAFQMPIVDGAGGRFGRSPAMVGAAVTAPPRPRRLAHGSAPGVSGHPR